MLEFGSHSRNDLGTGIEKGLGINRFVDRSRACDGKKKGGGLNYTVSKKI